MEFIKSVLVGIVIILVLLFLTGSQILTPTQDAGGFEAIGIIFILIFIAPAIILFSIIGGIKKQSNKKRVATGNKKYGISTGTYLIILFILAVFFIRFILPYLPIPKFLF